METLRQPAVILQITELQETDLLVVLLGEKTGKIKAVARGAKRSKKRFLGGLDIFDCGVFELHLTQKASGFPLLQTITDRLVWPTLRSNLKRLTLASYCLELTNSFIAEGDPESHNAYPILLYTLRGLNKVQSDEKAVAVSCFFALRILRFAGLNILDHEWGMKEELRDWFTQMLSTEQPILPHDRSVLFPGLLTLTAYAQEMLGYRIKTDLTLARLSPSS